jgi:hypothetical protein
MMGALKLGRYRVPAAVHVHAARRDLSDKVRALEAAAPPEMGQFPHGLAVVVAPDDLRVTDGLAINLDP